MLSNDNCFYLLILIISLNLQRTSNAIFDSKNTTIRKNNYTPVVNDERLQLSDKHLLFTKLHSLEEITVHQTRNNSSSITNYLNDEKGESAARNFAFTDAHPAVSKFAAQHRPDVVYFIVAIVGGAKVWARTVAQTLLDIGLPFSSTTGSPLRPLFVDIPHNGRFSIKTLMSLCQQADMQPLTGIVVIGNGQSARAIALSASAMQLPVLWAKGGTANLDGMHREAKIPYQTIIQPSGKETLEAIRAVLLETHWHSFFVLSDVGATIALAGNEGNPLKDPPLFPIVLPLPAHNKDDIFRQLSKISRSTRGIIVLLCDLITARKTVTQAQRLNMVGGHFIWLWADTTSKAEYSSDWDHLTDFDMSKYTKYDDQFHSTDTRESLFGERNQSRSLKSENELNQITKPINFEDKAIDRVHLQQQKIDEFLERKYDFQDFIHRKTSQLNEKLFSSVSKKPKLKIPNQAKHPPPDRYIFGLNDMDSRKIDEIDIHDDNLMTDRKKRRRQKEIVVNDLPAIDSIPQVDFNVDEIVKFSEYILNGNINAAGGLNHRSESADAELVPKLKRKPFGTYSNFSTDQSYVFFHNFNDFPIGLLALRPVPMDIDRYFIRSTVRIFAMTWAKIYAEILKGDILNRSSTHQSRVHFGASTNDRHIINNNQSGDNPKWPNNKNRHRQERQQLSRKRRSNNRTENYSKFQVNNQMFIKSDLIKNIIKNKTTVATHNSFNQNISGLITKYSNNIIKNNYKFLNNINITNIIGAIKQIDNSQFGSNNRKKFNYVRQENNGKSIVKRQNTWWAKAEHTDKVKTFSNYQQMYNIPYYANGCFGSPRTVDSKDSEYFAKCLSQAAQMSLSGQKLFDGTVEHALTTQFELLNLVPDLRKMSFDSVYIDEKSSEENYYKRASDQSNKYEREYTRWRRVGRVSGRQVHLDTIVWPGGDIVVSGLSSRARTVFRIVTALAPPFVMESELDEDGLCLRGLQCHRLSRTGHYNLTMMFNEIETRDRLEEDAAEHGNELPPDSDNFKRTNGRVIKCCYGLSMDLLDNIATELGFEFHLYIVRDELFGAKFRNLTDWKRVKDNPGNVETNNTKKQWHAFDSEQERKGFSERKETEKTYKLGITGKRLHQIFHNKSKHQWNGIIGDLVSGLADMSFAPLSVSKSRAEVIDFSVPYFHSGVSLLAAPQTKSEIPLLAFLLPFSPELWIAIFTSLNITAVAVAVYEWLSPFGLNPWGRQRTKNFSMSSALWVMWGLLCGHLVAFKAPKSWPNKFLINVWGGFSVIFVASYTANIAALIAGLFFHNAANIYDVNDLTMERVGAPVSSATEYYVQKKDPRLWSHMQKFSLRHIEDGIRALKNGTIDLVMADSPVLDYYRATDHGCRLQRIGEIYVEDAYAIGMVKGFPLKDSISALIAKYSSNGYLDILTEKWYGGLPCFKFEADIVQPRPLGVAAVAGVFMLLGLGMILGIIILIFEHWFYKFALPRLRLKSKDTVWKSRNIMFFSQKLYRFINCVELVSPHHAARELVHSLRQGQIASLFQKSIKRKEDEQRRRRKSKAQFFEMIQEIRRVQQIERENTALAVLNEIDTVNDRMKTPSVIITKPKPSPKPLKLLAALKRDGRPRSRSNSSVLSIRHLSSDNIFCDRMDTIGRRLSRDISYSPPDLGIKQRFETFGKNNTLNPNIYSNKSYSEENIGDDTQKNDTDSFHLDHFKPSLPTKIPQTELFPEYTTENDNSSTLRDQMNKEFNAKYGQNCTRHFDYIERPLPPIPSHSNETRKPTRPKDRHRQRSLDGCSDSPRSRSKQQQQSSSGPQSLSKASSKGNLKQMSLDRLSREDLLQLSQSTQSEIHEYLNNSIKTVNQKEKQPP